MLKIYRILLAIGVGLGLPALVFYFLVPEYRSQATYLVMLGVMIYGLAHVAGMKHYKDLYDKVYR